MGIVNELLQMQAIYKVYPNGVAANKGVDFSVAEGEIHALVGENGAGKSTLMKILYGMEQPTSGQIIYQGQPVKINSPRAAISMGIGMVHQHFMLVPSLTVAENIVLGSEPRRGLSFDLQRAKDATAALAQKYGLNVDPGAVIENISVGKRQRVEILKTLYRGARLLILDEPTAVLTPQETDELFLALRSLVNQGHTVIFITHKLREVMEISDRVTVMRDGARIGTLSTKETTKEQISRMMVGRDVLLRVTKEPARPKETVLEVSELCALDDRGKPVLKDVSFLLRQGEILGLAGVEGNGQSELVEVLTGLRAPYRGRIKLLNREVTGYKPKFLRKMGLAHIPEDRLVRGVSTRASIEENILLDVYDQKPYAGRVFLSSREIAKRAKSLIAEFKIKAKDEKTPVGSLSGGNMQKVVVARELAKKPKVLIAAQPTRGVDIGAIEFIHKEIIRQRDQGTAVLLVSAELSEVMSLSDRIGVMYNGQLVALFEDARAVTEEELGLYMLGVKKQQGEPGGEDSAN